MVYEVDSVWVAATVLVMALPIVHLYSMTREQKRTIDRQNDTIQRLINREPVTYQEVGAKPKKPVREHYAAWGNQLINIDEDESRQ